MLGIRIGHILLIAGVSLSIFSYPLLKSQDARIAFTNTYAMELRRIFKLDAVIVGDSILRGNDFWFLTLRTHPAGVVNLARGGFTTSQLKPISKNASKLSARLALYMSGTNDAGQNTSIEVMTASFRENIVSLRDSGARVIVLLSPPTSRPHSNKRVSENNLYFAKIAREEGVEFIDTWSALLEGDVISPKYTTDGTHLTREGYAKIKELLAEVLKGNTTLSPEK